jgi:hypothetical protein
MFQNGKTNQMLFILLLKLKGFISWIIYFIQKHKVTKGVIRSCKFKKDRQYNGQKKKYKRTNNSVQNTSHKSKTALVV